MVMASRDSTTYRAPTKQYRNDGKRKKPSISSWPKKTNQPVMTALRKMRTSAAFAARSRIQRLRSFMAMPPTAMPKQHSARKKPNRGHSQSAQGRPWTNRRPAHRHVHEVHGHQPDRKRRAGKQPSSAADYFFHSGFLSGSRRGFGDQRIHLPHRRLCRYWHLSCRQRRFQGRCRSSS